MKVLATVTSALLLASAGLAAPTEQSEAVDGATVASKNVLTTLDGSWGYCGTNPCKTDDECKKESSCLKLAADNVDRIRCFHRQGLNVCVVY